MVTFVVSIILARLLLPEYYGTIALIDIFISIMQVFVDSGLSTALIQKNVDDLDYSSVFYFNVAGNTVTALLDASYADFKNSIELQNICRKIMDEFITVTMAEHVYLEEQDVENIISYFINYKGDKITSMLDDVRNKNRTENDYITGEIIRVAKKHGIVTPVNDTMYMLVKAKESLYLK